MLGCSAMALATELADGYGLQPGDIIRISIWGEQELDQAVLVRPDGGISFPLVGDVEAKGKTIDEVTRTIAERLAQFVPSPVVTVSLQQTEGNRIFVTGRVNQPGVLLINRPIDIMQAIAMAGGLTPFAVRSDIKVLRREGDDVRVIPFDYKAVERGRALEQNVILRAGDTLVVP